jgi:hypothetical protein
MRRIFGVLLAVTMGVGLVACGDDGGGKTLSKKDFVEQANAMCKTGNDEVNKVFEDAFPNPDESSDPKLAGDLFLKKALPRLRRLTADLRDLKPPKEMQKEVAKLLDDVDAVIDDVEKQVKKDPEAYFSQEEDPFADVNQRARDLGLTVCGDEQQ